MIRTRQPVGYAAIRPYWRSRGLTFLFNGATFQDLVTGKFATNSGGVVRRRNAYGSLGPDISGAQYLEFPDSDALDITGALSILWRGTFDATTGNYRNVVSKADTNGASNTPFEIYLASSDGKLTTFRASGSGYRGYQSDATDPFGGQATSTMGVIYADGLIQTAPVCYANQTQLSVTSGNTDTGNCTGNAKTLRLGRRQDGATQLDGSIECVALFNQALTSAEYLALYYDLWGELLAPDQRRIYFGAGGGTTAYNLDAQPGGYTVSGTAATLLRGIVLDAQPATYTVSGTAASIVRGYDLNAATGTFTATGTAATLLRGLSVNAAPGSFSVSGAAATLEKTTPGVYTLDAQPGSYSLTGVAATLTYTPLNAYTLDAQPASYVLTGAAATLTYAGASIWTDVGVSAATWSDVGAASSIWTDL